MSAATLPGATTYPGTSTWPSSGVVIPGPAIPGRVPGPAAVASAAPGAGAVPGRAAGPAATASGSG